MKNILIFSLMFTLVACGPSASANPSVPTQTRSVISTAVLQPTIASTATDSPIFATLTAIAMLPSKTPVPPTPAAVAERTQGGVTIARGTSQRILFGQRAGTGDDGIHIVNAETYEEVETQKGLEMALVGNGPPLYTLFADQPFSNGKGETVLANMSIGVTEDPNIYVVVMWTGAITTTFPASEPSGVQEDLFSVQSGEVIEQEGWLEYGRVGLSKPALGAADQEEGFDFILFHHNDETYVLGFLPNYGSVLPAEDMTDSKLVAHPGQDHTYLIKGNLGGSVWLPIQNMFSFPLPILQVNYIEKKK